MKKYTDKELKAMAPDEFEAIQKQAMKEFDELGEKLKKLTEPTDEQGE